MLPTVAQADVLEDDFRIEWVRGNIDEVTKLHSTYLQILTIGQFVDRTDVTYAKGKASHTLAPCN